MDHVLYSYQEYLKGQSWDRFISCIYQRYCKRLSSSLRLFADDCLLYHVISCEEDIAELQRDLNTMFKWSQLWQMKFNITKYVTLKCCSIQNPSLEQLHKFCLTKLKVLVALDVMLLICGIKDIVWSNIISRCGCCLTLCSF